MSQKPIVFFVRNKPQDADIIDLVLKVKRVFIGYPPFKKGVSFNETNLKSCTYDISKDSFDKDDIKNPEFWRGININKNLVNEVIPGSFVIVPRPERGYYYIGKIKKFELVNNPGWKADYKKIRLKQNLLWNEKDVGYKYHVGDIIQCWIVEDFKPVSPFNFPAWTRHSLFGRSTIGRIKDLDDNNQVHKIISNLYDGKRINLTDKSVKDKLLYLLSPETFEHFMCNLLLLEYRKSNQIWIHIGGSGDGGIDCVGFDKNSKQVVGIAQCKLKRQSVKEMKDILNDLNAKFKGPKFICNYYCTEHITKGKDLEILNQERILKLFEKHKDSNYWNILQ